MSNPGPLAERVLERAMEHGLTPEATLFLEMRNQILFGTGKVRDLSKEDEPGLYGRRQAFHRLMLKLFVPDDGMPLKKERISKKERARRRHRRIDQVPPTAPWMVGARQQDQFVVKFLMENFCKAMGGIIDPEDGEVFSNLSPDRKKDPMSILGVNAIGERLREELETELSSNEGDPTTFGHGPLVNVYVRPEDKGRNVNIDLGSERIYTLKEVLIERIKTFCQESESAQKTDGKAYLTIYWGDEKEAIEVEFPRESSV